MSARRGPRGFTLIELVVSLTIVSVLVRIGMPAYSNIRRDAIAARAMADMNAVRAAAFAAYAANGAFPPDKTPGVIPAQMSAYLPPRFSFTRPEYQIDWENWVTASGGAVNGTGVMLGVSITTTDKALGNTLVAVLGKTTAHWTLGNNYTFVILATDPNGVSL